MDLLCNPAVKPNTCQRYDHPDIALVEIVDLSSGKHEDVTEREDGPKRPLELMFHIAAIELEDCCNDSDEDSDLTDERVILIAKHKKKVTLEVDVILNHASPEEEPWYRNICTDCVPI